MASMTPAQAPPKVAGGVSTSDPINVPPMAQELFEKYSLLAPDDVAPHVAQIVRSFRPPSGFSMSSRCNYNHFSQSP